MSIINGFKGTLDFYLHCGIPCVRRWPRSPGHRRTAPVMAQWPAWTVASRLWRKLSPDIQAAWVSTAKGTNLSGRDLQMKAYISGYHHHHI